MSTDLSIVHLIRDASLVVQIVMGLLVLASLISWTLILIKAGKIKRACREAERFEERFWSGASLSSLYEDLVQKKERQGLERVFCSGFQEYKRIMGTNTNANVQTTLGVDSVQRIMRVASSREIDTLEQNLAFLATVGSTSPYVGLFGTVWGIMNSFMALGQIQQATLAVVAPGIAEALIATAIGLFAAIPAVIAYNRFTDSIDRLANYYDNFREEFTAVLQRNLATRQVRS
ncbi:MAG: protein TolQ [Proteobacteria bacterium]|nr:MAG: protein TolQ [Pseudomonadota bacterium]